MLALSQLAGVPVRNERTRADEGAIDGCRPLPAPRLRWRDPHGPYACVKQHVRRCAGEPL